MLIQRQNRISIKARLLRLIQSQQKLQIRVQQATVPALEHQILRGNVGVAGKPELLSLRRVKISNQAITDRDVPALGASPGVISRDVGSAAQIGLAMLPRMCLCHMFEEGPGEVYGLQVPSFLLLRVFQSLRCRCILNASRARIYGRGS